MFGYIVPRLDQLDEGNRQRYQAFYCGLCRILSEKSGHAGRMTLSHDMTFLALLLGSLYAPKEDERSFRCPVHPFRRQAIVRSTMLDYAAEMNLLLMIYKCRDKKMDEGSFLGAAGERILIPALKRIQLKWPVQAAAVQNALEALWAEEKKQDPDPDRLCNLSGEMLAAVFVPDPSDYWASLLAGLGAALGRFVYWMDAWEDLDRDLRSKCFNPLRNYLNRKDLDSFVQDVLEMMMAEAAEYFEMLPLEKDLDLLRNVVYSGVWQRYYGMRRQKKKEREA